MRDYRGKKAPINPANPPARTLVIAVTDLSSSLDHTIPESTVKTARQSTGTRKIMGSLLLGLVIRLDIMTSEGWADLRFPRG